MIDVKICEIETEIDFDSISTKKQKKKSVNGRIGLTTSVIPHINGKYPVWFEKSEDFEFIDRKNVVFL